MVGVAQLVERRTVAPNVVGSNPISHPNFKHVGLIALPFDVFLPRTGGNTAVFVVVRWWKGDLSTGAAWLKGRNSEGGREEQKHPYKKWKKRKKNILDTHRPSHGRHFLDLIP
jgi:hypothetical protein